MTETTADAPGRVNLIGEHTDYHQGFVLPAVIPQRTRVYVRRRDDRRVRALSDRFGDRTLEYEIGAETRTHDWIDYIQGVTYALRGTVAPLSGFEVRVESGVPLGSGLSSSAALEVSLLRALRDVFGLPLDDVSLAQVAQRVETEFVGAPVGIMDQMASSLGRDGEALFLDTRSLAFEHIPIPPAIELVVIDSATRHTHAGGEYATRRKESFEAAALLEVDYLRDLRMDDLSRIERLPPLLARRARHIVTENQRVLDAASALRAGNAAELGVLFDASHRSMRDDYETSTPEIETLVSIGQNDPDVMGARLTGGGFGGAVVMLARAGMGHAAAHRILPVYVARTGRPGQVLLPQY